MAPTSPIDAALEASSACLIEAQRVFGPTADVDYGERYATAGVEIHRNNEKTAREITVWSDLPLETLLICLKSLPSE